MLCFRNCFLLLLIATVGNPCFSAEELQAVGMILPRHAREIESNAFSVGAETMGREYTLYRYWRPFLGPLGVKGARIQSGWARTERFPGRYDWAWLDAIIPDMVEQGVRPWVCLSYGNPVYPEGGTAASSSPLPGSPEALAAWDRFVRAFVQRYAEQVHEWEIWNEPQHQGIPVAGYAAFFIRTAEIIRAEQPGARIYAGAYAGLGSDKARGLLDILKDRDRLHLVNAVTFHPYTRYPDARRSATLRETVRQYAPHIEVFQGECGIPSTPESFGALAHPENSELYQAGWALRRLLTDFAHGIRSSYFAIADMHYVRDGRLQMNSKGLLATHPDKTVAYAKPAYRAIQHLTALVDDRWQPVKADGSALLAETAFREACDLHLFAFSPMGNQPRMAAIWIRSADEFSPRKVDVRLTGAPLADPVLIDLRSGLVYAFSPSQIQEDGESQHFRAVPVSDSPVLLADRSLFQDRIGHNTRAPAAPGTRP